MQTRASMLLDLWRHGERPAAELKGATPYLLRAMLAAGLVEYHCRLTPKGERVARTLLPPTEAIAPPINIADYGDMSDIVRW